MSLNDPAREDMPALLRAMAPRPEATTPDCLDDETIAAAADGTLPPAARTAAQQHLASCARCRSAVAAVSRLLSDDAVAGAVKALDRSRNAPVWRIPAAVAAAAALVLLLLWPRPGDELPHRAPTITAATQPVPLEPIGAVADVPVLRWAAVPRADRYRVTLFDAAGGVLYEVLLSDTVVAVPDSVAIVAGGVYLWKVDARTGFDRWSASQLVEFSVAGGPTP